MRHLRSGLALAAVVVAFGRAVSAQTISGDGPPVWGANPRLVEEMRIGGIDVSSEAEFGYVAGIVVAEDGVIWVADGQVHRVLRFGPDGSFLDQVGREGQGPGEFRRITGIDGFPDGRVAVLDPGNARVSIFSPHGVLAGSSVTNSVMMSAGNQPVSKVDTAGRMFRLNLDFVEPGSTQARRFWGTVEPAGESPDTMFIPASGRTAGGGRPYPFGWLYPFQAATSSAFNVYGEMIEAESGEYLITRRQADGSEIRIQRRYEPIRVERAEREQYRENARHFRDLNGSRYNDAVPDTKPAFWALVVDGESRYWLV